ncbi:MAG: DNA mismatch repair protein MutS [Candidatus Cloacimonadales bacterium]|jgi:DNA mismatch repair protein MutS|nr:DNA mismatch repair protein MutS [Candidatus Cloacimonadota bacterium]MDD2649565.1 DNA mismatch repair protein MutS [Candidatus Cloacimonadota bacterium]MDX9977678.1 DNA mismatch repair protein MutS [Candidatus Cloacimonadales bacterium]
MSDNKKLTPLMQQYYDIKKEHQDKIILFRMGDFYETFDEDAKIASKILGITLTKRNKNDENAPYLAGFPYHALDNYLDKLVQSGRKIAIVEQMEDPKLAKGLVKRGIIEIITPGAIIDEKLIPRSDNVFLAVVNWDKNRAKAGYACLDVSTADFLFTELNHDKLHDEILRTKPKEIIVKNNELKALIEDFKLEYHPAITIYDTWHYEYAEAKKLIKEHFNVFTLESLGVQDKKIGMIAAAVALSYIKSLRTEDLTHLNTINYYSLDEYMQIDEISRRNLELFRSMRTNDREASLLSVIDETRTPMGTRLLNHYLQYPLMSIAEISNRHNAVESFKENIAFTRDLRDILYEIGDLSRIITRLATLRANARDLNVLASYLQTAPIIYELLNKFDSDLIRELQSNIKNYSEIVDKINKYITESPPITITEGNIINNSIHDELDELRLICRDGKGWIARLEESEKQKTNIPTLKIGFNKVFGYYIEITKQHKDKVPDNYIAKQTLVNAERYISPILKEHESRVLGAEERIQNLEHEIFSKLRLELSEQVPLIQEYISIVAQLDVLSNFAFIAHQNRYNRPIFNHDGILELEDCRHPVIEKLLKDEQFIPNDVSLNDDDYKIALITGPNMAGKSTYLRQIGLIVIMAQMGSYVPCKYANLPIFDKLFTRVGASDNLTQGQSTFLVEMIETANILHSATPDSLILLDEIGRGTSTFDGLSLAWSIVEHIHNSPKINAKTLFATHYHELTELENILPGVKNFNITIREWNEQLIFLRKVERGSADQSYGIQVARLAGVPQRVINRARQILKNLEAIEISPQGLTARIKKSLNQNHQMNIFDLIVEETEEKDKKLQDIKEIILDIDINELSPIQALQKLEELKKLLTDDENN